MFMKSDDKGGTERIVMVWPHYIKVIEIDYVFNRSEPVSNVSTHV
jgi:hypothetical protein